MSFRDQASLIQAIHASGKQVVLCVSGGGSRAIAELLEVPGASAAVLEAAVAYSEAALHDRLGGPVDQACSSWTGRAMAMASFERARALSTADPLQLCGVGGTASLATSRPKRGSHRVHVAWQSATQTVAVSCELDKGARDRAGEEGVATALVLGAVAEACGIDAPEIHGLVQGEQLVRREKHAPVEWTELLLGQRRSVAIGVDDPPKLLFPGAFHPLHRGHERMAAVASERLGAPVTWELSIANVAKPPLDFVEIEDRLQPLAGRSVLLTHAPTFVEKAAIAPGSVFIVGVDTLARIAEERFYNDNPTARDAALATIADHGCRFLVFGRLQEDRFVTLADVELPSGLRALCDEVPESQFREDISSTDLRAGGH